MRNILYRNLSSSSSRMRGSTSLRHIFWIPTSVGMTNGELQNKGFTLLEMLVVIGIVTMLGGALSFVDMNNYRADAFRTERGSLVMLLQTARADALNNVNQKPHGVAIHPGGYDGYVVFEGTSYASAAVRTEVAANYGVNVELGSPTEIVFEQLSGNSNYANAAITLADPERGITTTIFINHEGAIW